MQGRVWETEFRNFVNKIRRMKTEHVEYAQSGYGSYQAGWHRRKNILPVPAKLQGQVFCAQEMSPCKSAHDAMTQACLQEWQPLSRFMRRMPHHPVAAKQ